MADINALADRFNEAFNRHDVEALAALTSEDAEQWSPTGTVRGREAIKAYNQAWFDAFPDAKLTVKSRIVGDNAVAEEGTFEGTHTGTFRTPNGDIPPTGKTLKGPYCGITHYEGELGVRNSVYFDQVDLMTQLGLMPAMAGATS